MNYKETMNLLSPSGYAMPFELSANAPLEISLGYGRHTHPDKGEKFFHQGVDFKVAPATWLKALATGTVTGIRVDKVHGTEVQVTYDSIGSDAPCSYEVVYGHVSHVYCRFGQKVCANDNIAMSGSILHIEVKFNGKTIYPIDFLIMVRDNCLMESQKRMEGNNPEIAVMDMDVHTPYDAYQSEIDMLYSKYFYSYFVDATLGRYRVSESLERKLNDLIEEGLYRHYIYERIPSQFNPAGLGESSFDWQGRLQTILFEDFQLYLALKHGVFLSHLSEIEKKKLLTGH